MKPRGVYGDAIDRVFSIARSCGVDNPRVIGWDFPNVSQEQINVFNMHGYEAAWILPDGVSLLIMKYMSRLLTGMRQYILKVPLRTLL